MVKRFLCLILIILLAFSHIAMACRKVEPDETEEIPEWVSEPEADETEEIPEWVTEAVDLPRIGYHIFHSDAIGGDVSFHIYSPDSYHTYPSRHFPVLYYLHGSGKGIQGIPFLTNFFNQLITDGDIEPMLIVFPNGLPDGMWCNSKDGTRPVETIVIDELIPLVDSMFRTINSAEGRLIEGFSMGGYGAGRLGLKYHGLFAGFSMLGAGPLQLDFLEPGPYVPLHQRRKIFQLVYGGDMDYFEAQSPWRTSEVVADQLPEEITVRVVVGSLDNMLDNNRALSAHFTGLGIDNQFIEVPGIGHTPPALMQAIRDESIQFYNSVFSR